MQAILTKHQALGNEKKKANSVVDQRNVSILYHLADRVGEEHHLLFALLDRLKVDVELLMTSFGVKLQNPVIHKVSNFDLLCRVIKELRLHKCPE